MKYVSTFLLASILFSCGSGQSVLTEGEFAKVYRDSLKRRFPAVDFIIKDNLTIVGKVDSNEYRHFLDNAYLAYKQAPDSISETIRRFVTSSKDIYEERPVTVGNIVPVIKPADYLKMDILDEGDADKLELITEKYNDELIIAYAIDQENSISYLTPDDLKKLGIAKDSLLSTATNNLLGKLPDIKIEGGKGTYMITAGGNYEASLLLVDPIWNKEDMQVNGDFIVGIPNRGLLFVTGSRDKKGISTIKEMMADSYKTGDYPVSEHLFRWTGKKFERFH